MGLFFFKKKEKNKEDKTNKKQISEQQKIIIDFEKRVEMDDKRIYLNDSEKFAKIHQDLFGLIWFADGERKNYTFRCETIYSNDGSSHSSRPEPSAIYLSEKVCIVDDLSSVEKLKHYPSFIPIGMTSPGMTPEQRYVYMKFLEKPYDENFDIGYVFVLFYGLERFMYENNQLERCIRVLIKLRNTFKNKSFLMYSAYSILKICIYHNRCDLLDYFAKNDKKWCEKETDFNTFLTLAYRTNMSIDTKIVLNYYKEIGFKKNSYIKDYPDLFESELEKVIRKKYNNGLFLHNIIKNEEYINLINVPILCNYVIEDSINIKW